MTPDNIPPTPLRSQQAVRGYTVLCLTALMAMILALMENDRELINILLVAGMGALAVITFWRIGTPLLLMGLVLLEVYHRLNRPWYAASPTADDSPFMDAVLCAAVLAYAAGHSRLLSLGHTAFPIDLRRPPAGSRADGRSRQDGRRRRSAHLPGPWEIPLLALTAAGWAAAVSLGWLVLSSLSPPLGLSAGTWHGMLLIFVVGLTMAVLWAVFAYLDWSTVTPDEHLLFLQDQAWRETRLEQNSINRFVVWARLRGQRRKEKS